MDSSSCLPPDLLQRWNINVVPHELIIGGRSLRDGIDIGPGEFYGSLSSNGAEITTAAPRPQQFLEAFTESAKTTGSVLCLTLSRNFSSTYQAALAGAIQAAAGPEGFKVEVIDTLAAAGSLGLIALAAARWAAEGADLGELVRKVNGLIPTVSLIAFVDTLEYLVKGGRVGKFQAWAGTKLNVKPVMELHRGEHRVLRKPRGRGNAVECLLEVLLQRASVSLGPASVAVNVMHAAAAEDAAELARRVREETVPNSFPISVAELFVSEFTPVMGAHTGPGLLGLAFHPVYNGPSIPDQLA